MCIRDRYSRLLEAGAKSEWFDKRLVVTTSVYNIVLKNVLYPAGVTGQPNLLKAVGEETSTGFEFETTGQINANWFLIMAYAYNKAEIKDSVIKTSVGNQKPNAPKHSGSLWTKYVLNNGMFKGLGIGVGGNFVSARNVSLSDKQTLPGYGILNAALYYKVDKFQVQFNLNNVLDETYWVGGYDYLRLFPGAPRNWLATVAYTF